MTQPMTQRTIIVSLIWKFLERGGVQFIQFFVQVLLARVLLPEDYSAVALVSAFIAIANVFVQTGFNTALIQRADISKEDYSTAFHLSMAIALLIYGGLFVGAPLLARFYQMPVLEGLVRVLSLTILLGAYNSIQNAMIAKEMAFKSLFFSNLSSMFVSGALSIFLVFQGAGVWTLVAQQLSAQLVLTLNLYYRHRWVPSFTFSVARAKVLLDFGWKILMTNLIDTMYSNVRSLIIGKLFTPDILGFYNRGKQLPSLIIVNVNGSIQTVMLPAFSTSQDDVVTLKHMMRRTIMTSAFLIFPLLIGLMVVAPDVITLLFTDKWAAAIPFVQIYCLIYLLTPIHTANLQALIALGKSDVYLKLEVFKKIVGVVILMISIFHGVYIIALGEVVMSLIATLINASPNKKLLDYGYLDQLKDLLPSFTLAVVMGLLVSCLSSVAIHPIGRVALQCLVGGVFYVGAAKLLKLENYCYMEETLRKLFKK